MLELKYGLPSSDEYCDSAVGWLGRPRWHYNPQWYCPRTRAGNRKGYVQAPPECCHWVENGDEESTAAAINEWIHSSKVHTMDFLLFLFLVMETER